MSYFAYTKFQMMHVPSVDAVTHCQNETCVIMQAYIMKRKKREAGERDRSVEVHADKMKVKNSLPNHLF